ncbi:MAG: TerB family tellurite resistance protein [Roseateles sp.]|nr:MAG: TerB family tellurite resistance protein [Roseateles sp.]
MGFFKTLAYVAGGVGAVVLIPATGGGSLALAIGALGTTTAAGAAIGAGVGAAAAAVAHAAESNDEAYKQGKSEGRKAGELAAQEKYQAKLDELRLRLGAYEDMDEKLIGMYAVGLAVAKSDGEICRSEQDELDAFISGCMRGHLPKHIKDTIQALTDKPPTLTQALKFAREAKVPKEDVDDIIDIVAHSDGVLHSKEKSLITRWKKAAEGYELALGVA